MTILMSESDAAAKLAIRPSALLSETEVVELTGLKQPSAQVRALRKMGLNPAVRPDGTPAVLLEAVVRVQTQPAAKPRREPDFSKVA